LSNPLVPNQGDSPFSPLRSLRPVASPLLPLPLRTHSKLLLFTLYASRFFEPSPGALSWAPNPRPQPDLLASFQRLLRAITRKFSLPWLSDGFASFFSPSRESPQPPSRTGPPPFPVSTLDIPVQPRPTKLSPPASKSPFPFSSALCLPFR